MIGNGEKYKKWISFRKKWIKDNPPYDNGCYICGICGRWCMYNEVELDHIVSRSRRPDLVFDPSNIQPAHHLCNSMKGSSYIEPAVSKNTYDFIKSISDM